MGLIPASASADSIWTSAPTQYPAIVVQVASRPAPPSPLLLYLSRQSPPPPAAWSERTRGGTGSGIDGIEGIRGGGGGGGGGNATSGTGGGVSVIPTGVSPKS